MHVLGLCGSLRRDSYNRRLLAAAATQLPVGAVFHLFDHMADIPPYNEDADMHRILPAVQTLRRAIAAASGILIATPEYNASVPGVLKNALDWASRPYPDSSLRGKPVIVMGASITTSGAAQAQADLRRVLKAIGAHVLETSISIPQAHQAFAGDGQLADPQLRAQLVSLVHTLIDAACVECA